jgi:hypothetical protein
LATMASTAEGAGRSVATAVPPDALDERAGLIP